MLALVLVAAGIVACSEGSGAPEITGLNTNSPVEPNTLVRVAAQATTGSVCNLTVGEVLRSDGTDPERTVAPKSPDGRGAVSWRFGVPAEAVEQDFTVMVRCEKNEQFAERSATVRIGPRTRPLPTGTPTAEATP